MTQVLRRLVIAALLLQLPAYALGLAFALLEAPALDLLPEFQAEWTAARSLELYIDFSLAANLLATGFCFSVSLAHAEGASDRSGRLGVRATQTALVVFLIFAALYALAILIFQPSAVDAARRARRSSVEAVRYREEALQAREEGRAEDARDYARRYLALIPGDEGMERVSESAVASPGDAEETQEAGRRQPPRVTGTADEPSRLFELAQQFFREADYFSALYYAALAADIEPNREDYQRLRSQAAERIDDLGDSIEEETQQAVFNEKQRGQRALLNDDPVSAYQIFSRLAEDNPRDPDVQEFLARSREAAQNVTFFHEDWMEAEPMAGYTTVTFENPRSGGETELVHLGKIVESNLGIYVYDFEAIRFTDAGEVLLHLSAPGAQLRQSVFVLRSIERTGGAEVGRARFLRGRPEPGFEHSLPLNISYPHLIGYAEAVDGFGGIDIAGLFSLAGREDLALSAPVRIELVTRLVMISSFVSLSCFVAGIAWALRSRYSSRPPILAFALLPVVGAALYELANLYMYLMRVLSGFLVLQGGLVPALVVQIVVQFALLVASLIYFASRAA